MKKKLHTTEYVIALIDLLGASEAIKNDDKDINLNTVNNLLTLALRLCKRNDDGFIGKYEIKAFSDNIIIAHSLVDLSPIDKKKVVHDLLFIVSSFQYYAFTFGVLIRGGITFGDLYIDNKFVWGKALLRAYQLESTMAFYPRIVIDKNVFDFIKFNENHELCECHVIQDSDGKNFLDYCSFFYENDLETYLKKCEISTARIKELLVTDEKALQKLNWHESYLKKVQKKQFKELMHLK